MAGGHDQGASLGAAHFAHSKASLENSAAQKGLEIDGHVLTERKARWRLDQVMWNSHRDVSRIVSCLLLGPEKQNR